MNYSGWEEQTVNITALHLDSKNPRIPALGHDASQREIIAELVYHEGVADLAREIATQGFYPTEVLVCIEEQSQLVVVEGNRRLASLKLLLNPEAGPKEYVARFSKLAAKMSDPPIQQVNVVLAPSRAATAPLIMNRHTQLGVKGWEPIQQARYVNSLLQAGASLEQLAATTGFTKGDLLEGLRTHTMYELANKLDLEPKIADVVRDPRKFNASTLERVMESPQMRDFLGIEFDQEGGIFGNVHPDDFRRAYKRVIEDIVNGIINTRVLNDAKAIRSYIGKLASIAPKRQGSFTSGGLLGKTEESVAHVRPASTSVRAKRGSRQLIPKSFKCHLHMPRIRDVLNELQRLRVADFENAVGVLLRIFIELSISHYMESTGQMKVLIARLDKLGKKPKTWTPSLRQMLDDLLKNDPDIDIPRQARKALNKAVSDDDYPLSLDGMDQFAHNPYMAPHEKQLRQFWNNFEDLLQYLMIDHPPVTSKGTP